MEKLSLTDVVKVAYAARNAVITGKQLGGPKHWDNLPQEEKNDLKYRALKYLPSSSTGPFPIIESDDTSEIVFATVLQNLSMHLDYVDDGSLQKIK